MSHKNRTRRRCERWDRMTYENMLRRRCDYPRPWMKRMSKLRRAMYWADWAKGNGVAKALYRRWFMERHLL